MKKYTLSLAALFIASTAVAAPHHGPSMIGDYDRDGDGVLTRAEFHDARLARFNKTDTNGDKIVKVEEYLAEYETRLLSRIEKDRKRSVDQAHIRFKSLDDNKNNTVEWAEITGSADSIFTHYDTNKDGAISEDDPKRKRKEYAKAADHKKKKTAHRRSLLAGPSSHSLKGVLKLYDTNGDNKVTRKELTDKRQGDFTAKDKNKNGTLDEREYVGDFEDVLDERAKNVRKMQVKQTYVRFDAIDSDKDKSMTFDEYEASGLRFFTRYDTNEDGALSSADPAPKPRMMAQKK